jgi:hypothetical protein
LQVLACYLRNELYNPMQQPSETEKRIPIFVHVLYYGVLGACTILPWVVHFTLSWWSALLVWYGLVALYDKLFVPKGSICMGIQFMIPLSSLVLLLAYDAMDFAKWLLK